MGVDMIVSGADFSASGIFDPPVDANWKLWSYPQSLAKAAQNLIDGGGGITVTGTPVDLGNAVKLKTLTNSLDTTVAEQAVQSWLMVCRADQDTFVPAQIPAFMGSYGTVNGTTVGAMVSAYTANRIYLTWSEVDANGVVTQQRIGHTVVQEISQYRFYAAVSDGVNYAFYDKTAGLTYTMSRPGTTRALGAGLPIRLGSRWAGASYGENSHAFDAICNAALSAAEVDVIYKAVKVYLASLATPITI
jgi:hypothetical protein